MFVKTPCHVEQLSPTIINNTTHQPHQSVVSEIWGRLPYINVSMSSLRQYYPGHLIPFRTASSFHVERLLRSPDLSPKGKVYGYKKSLPVLSVVITQEIETIPRTMLSMV